MIKILRGVWLLVRKDCREIFHSPLIYFLAALFCVITGLLFFYHLSGFQNLTESSLVSGVLRPLFGNVHFILLFMIPLLGMNSFVEEKRLETLDRLLMSELPTLSLILGKWISLCLSIFFLLSFLMIFPFILWQVGFSDWPQVMMSFIALLSASACYCALTIFCSSVCQRSLSAAFLSFFLVIFNVLLIMMAHMGQNFLVSQMIQYLSVAIHFEGLTSGLMKSYSVVFGMSFIFLFIYLTHVALKARRW